MDANVTWREGPLHNKLAVLKICVILERQIDQIDHLERE